MIWSNRKPTRPGWYWRRTGRDRQVEKPHVVKIVLKEAELWIEYTKVRQCVGEWAGPIVPPSSESEPQMP